MAYQVVDFAGEARSLLVRPKENDRGGHWLRRLVARHSTRVMLGRILRRRPVHGIEELPPHLLRDIGLPQDFRRQGGLAHLHPPV